MFVRFIGNIGEDSYLLGLQIGVFKVPTSVALMPANLL